MKAYLPTIKTVIAGVITYLVYDEVVRPIVAPKVRQLVSKAGGAVKNVTS